MIMKRNIYLLFALWVFSANVGCPTNFDEINRNPNEIDEGAISPTGMLQETLYTGAEVLLYRTWQLNGELIQYTVSGTGNNSYHRYVITNSVMESAWSNLFKWAANAEAMRRLAVDQQNVNCEAVAITLKTLYLSNLTDMFGEIPCSEAFRGSGENLTKPRFDTQRAVYEQLLADLEYANSIYDTSVAMSSAQRDLLYGGDMMKWRKFNNSLYLRLLMRLSNRDREMGIAARVRAVFEDSAEWPVFTSNDDNATFYYDEVNLRQLFRQYPRIGLHYHGTPSRRADHRYDGRSGRPAHFDLVQTGFGLRRLEGRRERQGGAGVRQFGRQPAQ